MRRQRENVSDEAASYQRETRCFKNCVRNAMKALAASCDSRYRTIMQKKCASRSARKAPTPTSAEKPARSYRQIYLRCQAPTVAHIRPSGWCWIIRDPLRLV